MFKLNREDSMNVSERELRKFWLHEIFPQIAPALRKLRSPSFPWKSLEQFLLNDSKRTIDYAAERAIAGALSDYVNLRGRYSIESHLTARGYVNSNSTLRRNLAEIIAWIDSGQIEVSRQEVENESARYIESVKSRELQETERKRSKAYKNLNTEIAKAIADADLALRKRQSHSRPLDTQSSKPPRVPLQGSGDDWREQE